MEFDWQILPHPPYSPDLAPSDFYLFRSSENYEKSDRLPLGIFIDLTRAFDCVNHNMLLEKLEMYGVRGVALHLIKSYLSNRTQMVKIVKNNHYYYSSVSKISAGVPQGSILGPILFVIFVNDLQRDVGNDVHLVSYADDTNLLLNCSDFQSAVLRTNITMQNVTQWFLHNNLVKNETKTNYMLFRTTKVSAESFKEINIDGQVFPFSTHSRFLGMHIDNVLSWSTHIDELCKRMGNVCYSFCVMRKYLSLGQLKILYFTNFQSVITFGIISWGKNSEKVFLIQKRIIRIITNMSFRESCRGVFKKLNILTCSALYIYELLVYFIKHKTIIEGCKFRHNYETRGVNYAVPTHRLTLYERSPLYMIIKVFNALPNHIKETNDVKLFEQKLYCYLIDKEPYSVGEYFASI